eukprot:1157935-Pelagomonas_calceolata.AAC.1
MVIARCCSLSAVQAKTLALKRQKVAHHLEDKNKLLLEGPGSNPTEEYGTSGQQPYTLVMTKHNPTSSLYYSPQQVRNGDERAGAIHLGCGQAHFP